jgi:protein-disulfide isomerase
VQIVFRDLPLSMHPNAQGAAEAAQCAHEQGKFWEYHDKLFASQQALGRDQLKQYATDLGLDAAAFNACFDAGKPKDSIAQDAKDAEALGVTGTPAFFINGRFVSGALPYEAFASIIDEEIQSKGGGAAKGK